MTARSAAARSSNNPNAVGPEPVTIACPAIAHADLAAKALERGLHVYVEKPIALSLEDADAIIAAAEKKGVVVCACHQNRFNKSVQKIREALEAGRFGHLLHGAAHIRWSRNQDYYQQAPWRGTWAQDGGALMNQCIHNIDLLRWMMGSDITEVVGMTDNLKHDYIEAEDLGLALVKFANGSYGLIEGTTNIYPNNLEETLYLFGENGTVKAGGKSVNIIEEWRFADGADDPDAVKAQYHENPPNVYGFGHQAYYQHVVDCLLNQRAALVDGLEGRKSLELISALYESIETGQEVALRFTPRLGVVG